MQDYFTDKIYQLYYDEVGKHPILSPTEERDLLLRYHNCSGCKRRLPSRIAVKNCPACGTVVPSHISGKDYTCENCDHKFDTHMAPRICPYCGSPRDLEARQKLVESNLRFVIRRAKSITTKPEHLRKLVSAGNVGLMLAIDKFSLERQTRFLTYAEWWIRKEMFDEIHSSSFIHVPTHRQKSLRREQKEGKYICKHCGLRTDDPDSREHWTGCTDIDHEFILPLNNDSAVLNDAVSLDDVTLVDTSNVENLAIDSDAQEHLHAAIQDMTLSERDRFIIMGYFNVPLPDRKSEPKSLHQLAALTGITPERVRQIKEETLKVLRKELKRRAIEGVDEVCI